MGRDLLELARGDIFMSLAMTFVVMMASFILIPNISAYVLYNLGYPRSRLGLLYLVGGAVSLVTMRFVGKLVDRHGSVPVGTFGVLLLAVIVYTSFVMVPPVLPVMVIFAGFMVAMAFRNVAYNTLTTKVPRPDERARFSSVQSAVQHLASALGAFASAQFLSENADHSLVGVGQIAMVSIALGLVLPPFLWAVERRVASSASSARK